MSYGKSDYCSLHSHLMTSLLDGFSSIDEALEKVAENGQKALGVTDHGSVASIYNLLQKAPQYDIIPVPGIEAYMSPINNRGGSKLKEPVFYGKGGRRDPRFDVSAGGAYTHQTLLAYTNKGLNNLFRISTESYKPENYYQAPRIDSDYLFNHADGMIATSGCPSSEISTRLLLGQYREAREYAGRMMEAFGRENFFIEIMNHNMKNDLERLLLQEKIKLKKDLNVPFLITNDTHYTHKHEAIHHEEFLCTQSGSRMSDPTREEGGKRFCFDGDGYYFKTTDEMYQAFKGTIDEEYIREGFFSSVSIAEKAQDLHIAFDPHLKPEPFIPSEFSDKKTYYQYLLKKGFQERYGHESQEIQEEAKRRIREEMKVIHSSDFIGYMLTVYEYIQWTNQHYSVRNPQTGEILMTAIGSGRGSVGGSIHAYILGISNVDPIRDDLMFSRFLSEGRGATYRITYDDGSVEETLVSTHKTLEKTGEIKYIHELNVGDIVR